MAFFAPQSICHGFRQLSRALYRTMKDIKESWKELVEEGETTVHANAYQRLHLVPQTRLMGFIFINRISRTSLVGKVLYSILYIMQRITLITCPYASDLFWIRVEARWICDNYKYIRTKGLGMSYTFFRKKNLSFKEIEMLLGKVRVDEKNSI